MAMITVRAAADRLGVSYSAFKQWIYKGSVRTVRTGGGHHRIAEAEVERLLAVQGAPLPRAEKRDRRGPTPSAGCARGAERAQPVARASSRKCASRGCWRRCACASAISG